jgi:signal transduction histidine kinase
MLVNESKKNDSKENIAYFHRLSRLKTVSWSLQTKFLFSMALILLFCCLAGTFIIYSHQKNELEVQAMAKSELVMAAVDASRQYVIDELRPTMFKLMGEDHFVREAMSSSYVGRAVMDRFSPALPDIIYRRVSQNARNPKYEVDYTELGMLEYFRSNPSETEWQGIIQVDGQAMFKRFKPVIFELQCLHCHGRPEDAPLELIKMYGSEGGFGRVQGQVGGLVSVGIPVHAALAKLKEKAVSGFLLVFTALSVIFLSMGFIFNRMVVTSLKDLLKDFQDMAGISGASSSRNEFSRLGAGFNTIMEELHASREKLENWNKILEEEVSRTRQELESAQKQLIYNEKMAALGRMTANITHAIRNPLTAMGGFARRIESLAQNDQERKYARIILKEMYRLEKILKDIVVFSQDKCCTQPFEPKNMEQVLKKVLNHYHEQFQERKVRVRMDLSTDLPLVLMDEDKVCLLLENLVENSLEAMTAGGEIFITLTEETGENEQRLVKLSLADTGPGVPEKIMPFLFEPFSTSKDQTLGSGLGLPICRKIIEEHGGWINAENLPEQGAVFYLYFPAYRD